MECSTASAALHKAVAVFAAALAAAVAVVNWVEAELSLDWAVARESLARPVNEITTPVSAADTAPAPTAVPRRFFSSASCWAVGSPSKLVSAISF